MAGLGQAGRMKFGFLLAVCLVSGFAMFSTWGTLSYQANSRSSMQDIQREAKIQMAEVPVPLSAKEHDMVTTMTSKQSKAHEAAQSETSMSESIQSGELISSKTESAVASKSSNTINSPVAMKKSSATEEQQVFTEDMAGPLQGFNLAEAKGFESASSLLDQLQILEAVVQTALEVIAQCDGGACPTLKEDGDPKVLDQIQAKAHDFMAARIVGCPALAVSDIFKADTDGNAEHNSAPKPKVPAQAWHCPNDEDGIHILTPYVHFLDTPDHFEELTKGLDLKSPKSVGMESSDPRPWDVSSPVFPSFLGIVLKNFCSAAKGSPCGEINLDKAIQAAASVFKTGMYDLGMWSGWITEANRGSFEEAAIGCKGDIECMESKLSNSGISKPSLQCAVLQAQCLQSGQSDTSSCKQFAAIFPSPPRQLSSDLQFALSNKEMQSALEQCDQISKTEEGAVRSILVTAMRQLRLAATNKYNTVTQILQRNMWSAGGHSSKSQRDSEFRETLQWNLCHPQVAKIHLVVESDELLPALEQSGLHDPCGKITPWLLNKGRRMHYKDAFTYAFDKFKHKRGMIMNADIAIGEGFYLGTPDYLQDHFIALARKDRPTNIFKTDCCTYNYDGCMDAFLFKSPIEKLAGLPNELDFPQNIWGAEGRIMWEVKNHFHVNMTNPCMRLRTYHNHASNQRGAQVESQANEGKNGMCCPSWNLNHNCNDGPWFPCPKEHFDPPPGHPLHGQDIGA